MTDAIIFQLLGLTYLVVGIGLLFNLEFYKKLLEDFTHNLSASYLGGVMALLVGYLLVVYHNIWQLEWTVLITITGWLALLKGLMILIMPSVSFNLAKALKRNKNYLYTSGIILGIFGIILLYLGFLV